MTTAGSIIFVIFSVGLTGFLVGSALFVVASFLGFLKSVHNANRVLWRRREPVPNSLRLHSFSSTGVVRKPRESARLTHWLQGQAIVGKSRNRVILQKARANELASRRIRASFPALTTTQLQQIEETLDVVASMKAREPV